MIAQGMSTHLAAEGFEPIVVSKGEQGLARLRYENPDVCVLDLMLPERDGWSVIETAREEGIGTPIVVVSARGTEHDRVHALEIGADDYLVKPFSMKELAARVRVAARRGVRPQETPRGEVIEVEELRIDPREVQAYVAGESADLTPTEFRLLYALALEDGRVVSRDELLQRLWGRRETHRDRTVDVFVKKLREKLDRPGARAHVHPDALRRRLQVRAAVEAARAVRRRKALPVTPSVSARNRFACFASAARPEPPAPVALARPRQVHPRLAAEAEDVLRLHDREVGARGERELDQLPVRLDAGEAGRLR